MINKNTQTKTSGELIHQLTKARATQKKPNAVKDVTPVAQQPDLSHLPLTERLTLGRKLAEKHNLSAANPAPIVAPIKGKVWDFPEPDERTKRIKAMWLEMEAATKDNDK
jgi:hypothetical protein